MAIDITNVPTDEIKRSWSKYASSVINDPLFETMFDEFIKDNDNLSGLLYRHLKSGKVITEQLLLTSLPLLNQTNNNNIGRCKNLGLHYTIESGMFHVYVPVNWTWNFTKLNRPTNELTLVASNFNMQQARITSLESQGRSQERSIANLKSDFDECRKRYEVLSNRLYWMFVILGMAMFFGSVMYLGVDMALADKIAKMGGDVGDIFKLQQSISRFVWWGSVIAYGLVMLVAVGI